MESLLTHIKRKSISISSSLFFVLLSISIVMAASQSLLLPQTEVGLIIQFFGWLAITFCFLFIFIGICVLCAEMLWIKIYKLTAITETFNYIKKLEQRIAEFEKRLSTKEI